MTAKLITYNGVTDHIAGWAKRVGLSRQTLHYRLKIGWTVEHALTAPCNRNGNRAARMFTFRGELRTAKEIAEITGLSLSWVYQNRVFAPKNQGANND